MFVVLVKNKVELECLSDYIQVSKKFAQDMNNVEGCTMAKVLTSSTEKDIVTNLEIWESKEAYDKYDGSIFLKYKPELKKGFLGNTTETYFG